MLKKSLGEIAHVFAGKASTRLKPGDDEAPLVNLRDIGRDGLAPVNRMERVAIASDERGRFGIQPGDLIASVRGTFKVAVAISEHDGAVAGANTAVIRLRNGIPPNVVAAFLRHPEMTARLMSAFTGSTIQGISLENLKQTQIGLPDHETLTALDELVDAEDRYHRATLVSAEARRTLMLELVRRSMAGENDA